MLKTFIHKGCDSFNFFFCIPLFVTTMYRDRNPLHIEKGGDWNGGAWGPAWLGRGSVLPPGREEQGALGTLRTRFTSQRGPHGAMRAGERQAPSCNLDYSSRGPFSSYILGSQGLVKWIRAAQHWFPVPSLYRLCDPGQMIEPSDASLRQKVGITPMP